MKTKLTGKNLASARKQAEPFKGVCVDISNPNKPYKAIFMSKHLGYFDNAVDAALAYNKKAKSEFGNAKLAKIAKRWNEVKN
jgi:hypothetical protein